ncbi:hypothetical protein D9M72_379480 [compost metagenome]
MRVHQPVDGDLAHQLAVRGFKVVGGGDESAAGVHHAVLDGLVQRELPVDQHAGGVRGKDSGGLEFEVLEVLVRDGGILVFGDHVAHRFALVDGEHREGA